MHTVCHSMSTNTHHIYIYIYTHIYKGSTVCVPSSTTPSDIWATRGLTSQPHAQISNLTSMKEHNHEGQLYSRVVFTKVRWHHTKEKPRTNHIHIFACSNVNGRSCFGKRELAIIDSELATLSSLVTQTSIDCIARSLCWTTRVSVIPKKPT